MKTLLALCLVTTLGLSTAQSAQQEGNPEAAKIAREGSQAARDQDWNKAIERFRKAAVEITFEGDRYLVVPQAAILALVRDE